MELKHSITLNVKRHVIVYLAMSGLNTELSSWTYWTFYLDIMIRKEIFLDRCAETFKRLTLYQSGKKFHQQTKSTDCRDIFLYLIKAKPWSLMYQSLMFIKVCRQSRKTFLFLFCYFLLLFFFLLSYFSLPPPASRDFSVISQPISMKFGMLIVLDETNRLNIFSSQ